MADRPPSSDNPYAAPPPPALSPGRAASGRCPWCGSRHYQVPSFTWWGGAVGHKLLHHVHCRDCGKGYNVKTGRSNTTNIVIYQIVVAAILLPVMIVLSWVLLG